VLSRGSSNFEEQDASGGEGEQENRREGGARGGGRGRG
jgi:hypothetical protein